MDWGWTSGKGQLWFWLSCMESLPGKRAQLCANCPRVLFGGRYSPVLFKGSNHSPVFVGA